jgi:hypothetical protein
VSYQEFPELPDWSAMQVVDGKHLPAEAGKPMWSGEKPPPAVGEIVKANFNNLGAGEVLRYFVHEGYLGVIVRLADPPEFFEKQNGGNVPAHLFGAEICA